MSKVHLRCQLATREEGILVWPTHSHSLFFQRLRQARLQGGRECESRGETFMRLN